MIEATVKGDVMRPIDWFTTAIFMLVSLMVIALLGGSLWVVVLLIRHFLGA